MSTFDVSRAVNVYLKIRDARTKLKAEYDAQDKALVEQMDVLEKHFLVTLQDGNTDSLGTEHGTVYRQVKTRYWTSDWEAMHKFIKDNNALDLLERRIAQNAMKQFLADNPSLTPTGLNADSSYDVVVRRK